MAAIPAPFALYTAAQARALDRAAAERYGVDSYDLMQRAAWTAFAALRRRWPEASRIGVLCGPGNNGGDGFLLAKLALEAGLAAHVLAPDDAGRGDAARARAAFAEAGGRIESWRAALPAADVCVDALYGTGLNRAPQGEAAALIEALNGCGAPVLALDLPSGLDADSGCAPGAAVRAAATVSFVAWKRGLFTAQGPDHCGALELSTLDLPEALYAAHAPDARLLAAEALPPRARGGHKGDYGRVLVVGGDHGMGGAARLAGEAALRVGAGLVEIATRAEHVAPILAARPELMPRAVDGPQALAASCERADVIALGPGLGQGAWGHALWLTALLDAQRPLVLDADALNLLVREPRALRGPAVLTPHPGEAARLLGCDVAAVQRDRYAAVRALAQRYAAVTALKGAGTLIAAPSGEVAVCRWGNPGMASGGMGDVLTGVIAGLMAQGLAPWEAACLGVGLHARAGDLAAAQGERGLLASDLFPPLRVLVNGQPHE
ncbi:MAG: NAD(P)H-hydrate dehydratase [Mizugakiibacter sp.]|uniref:NAD(P)H-hydrate dehydratase n=1 Tax=Mizugakiibacter sp. TaxID=1972610 RepID=UPI0031C34CCC|nr:NAD(P)H-hydrate dehydratase [Xanthomonadaceae bacterium]